MGYTTPIIFFPILTIYFLQSKHDHRMIIYMNLKTTKMSEKLHDYVQKKFSKNKFYWDSDTIDYYVNFEELNGWASTAMRVYEYVADECEWSDEADMRALYLDLLTEVENKINK